MLRGTLQVATLPLMLVACGSADDAPASPMASDTPAAMAVAPSGALDLTEAQLRDADLVDANGDELGEVEEVIRGSDGTIEGLLIEIDDSDPDRYVQIALTGLEPVQDGDDWDLGTTATRADLMALPEAIRR